MCDQDDRRADARREHLMETRPDLYPKCEICGKTKKYGCYDIECEHCENTIPKCLEEDCPYCEQIKADIEEQEQEQEQTRLRFDQ